ncbi:MAG: SWIB/MDM2 domain-containing protein [Candidatus Methylacidiphilales bacterium]|nr:SWIB/MDM2 domain-containing protein [Candidatus Methylacidiphilales bacterium]
MPTAKKKTSKPEAKAPEKAAPAAPAAAAKPAGRTPNKAFLAPVTPDAVLAPIVGSKPLPRTDLTVAIWDYVKKHGLQDKANKRMINADAKLKAVFDGKDQVSMFEMTKLVNKHVTASK